MADSDLLALMTGKMNPQSVSLMALVSFQEVGLLAHSTLSHFNIMKCKVTKLSAHLTKDKRMEQTTRQTLSCVLEMPRRIRNSTHAQGVHSLV